MRGMEFVDLLHKRFREKGLGGGEVRIIDYATGEEREVVDVEIREVPDEFDRFARPVNRIYIKTRFVNRDEWEDEPK